MIIPPFNVQVRFADIDKFNHVNNAVYLSYFESARMYYFGYMLGKDWDWRKEGIILMKNEIEYLKPVEIDHQPKVNVYVEKIGNKSFVLGYRLEVNGELFCQGTSTLVGYDYIQEKSILIPPLMKEALLKLK